MEKIFETILPGWKGNGLPKEFPWHVRSFMRASFIVVHFFSFKNYFKPFGMLNEKQRENIIQKIYHHPNASIRNLVQFWKLTAFMTNAD